MMYYKSYKKENNVKNILKWPHIIIIILIVITVNILFSVRSEELVCDSNYICTVTRTYFSGKIEKDSFVVNKTNYMTAEIKTRRVSSKSSGTRTYYYIVPVIYSSQGPYITPFVKDFGSSSERISVEEAEKHIQPYIEGFENYVKNPAIGFSMTK